MATSDSARIGGRGIYFLANDRLYSSVVAFLNSLRKHNPDIPLCLIPYDRNTDRLRALETRYNFTVLDDEPLLASCDAISSKLHGRIRGHYRKIAAWSGKFAEFIYIDTDTVVLKNLDFIFHLLKDYDVVTAHSNESSSRRFVWLDSITPDAGLTADEIDYAANTGFILSRCGLFDNCDMAALVNRAKELSPHMELECVEQPFLNFLIIKTTTRYTSIRRLNEQSTTSQLPSECWPGDTAWQIQIDGTSSYNGVPREVLFVHWSGLMVPTKWEQRLYSVLKWLGIRPPAMRMRLKMGHLWRHYRTLKNC